MRWCSSSRPAGLRGPSSSLERATARARGRDQGSAGGVLQRRVKRKGREAGGSPWAAGAQRAQKSAVERRGGADTDRHRGPDRGGPLGLRQVFRESRRAHGADRRRGTQGRVDNDPGAETGLGRGAHGVADTWRRERDRLTGRGASPRVKAAASSPSGSAARSSTCCGARRGSCRASRGAGARSRGCRGRTGAARSRNRPRPDRRR